MMNHSELTERASVLKEVIRKAGEKALEFYHNRSQLEVQHKGVQDFVTQADKSVEQYVTQTLLSHFPNDSVFGEEMGGTPTESVWVIDPIDGTTNFIQGIPLFCVSIAFVHQGVIEIGMVYAPVFDELFSAVRGQGAYCNDVPIQTNRHDKLSEAILGIGKSSRTNVGEYVKMIEKLVEVHCEYRRFGTAALMLAYSACGRVDGYYESHLNSWDALAGLLLNEEAGAFVYPFLQGDALTQGNVTLTCPKALQNQFMEILNMPLIENSL